ncbi:MAG: D-alanine--D-alanine ligase [Christensenellaceae bacterium]|jgi:D-alanine-D-alanine ligase|nr:D-alanine--D-alanine ligase [Christensenellaceae bacterium]
MKKNVLVIFGGRSVEHDISVITGVQIINSVDAARYNVYPIYTTAEGEWFFSEDFYDINKLKDFDKTAKNVIRVGLVSGQKGLFKLKRKTLKKLCEIDCALFAVHGGSGENGALQGLFECLDIPYTSPGVLFSAVCMDKIITKKVLIASGLNTIDYSYILPSDLTTGRKHCIKKVRDVLEFPIIIKPSNLGSSIGISVCENDNQLWEGISVAAEFDRRILCERALVDMTEVNISVMGDEEKVRLSKLESPEHYSKFLTFEQKYLVNKKSQRKPAQVSDEQKEYIESSARKIWELLGGRGVIRIDYMIDNSSGKVFVNEVNTIPGSLSNYLWKKDGISGFELTGSLIETAICSKQKDNELNKVFSSNVLQNFREGAKALKK